MLETARLILRPMQDEDAFHLYELNADPDVIRYTGDLSANSLSEASKIIHERTRPQWLQFKMGRFSTLLKDGTYLGWCGLRYFPEQEEVDLGYRFQQRFWGQGYATESSKICLQYGFETLGLKRIVAKAMPENIASLKVLQKLRMTFRGLNTDPSDPHGLILYDLTADEWAKCKN
jgi:RimJ/RimL family protein N-acetyltransferase